MVTVLPLLLLLVAALAAPCSTLEDPVEKSTLAATGLGSLGRLPLTCSTSGMECSTDTFDGLCRVTKVSKRVRARGSSDTLDAHRSLRTVDCSYTASLVSSSMSSLCQPSQQSKRPWTRTGRSASLTATLPALGFRALNRSPRSHCCQPLAQAFP